MGRIRSAGPLARAFLSFIDTLRIILGKRTRITLVRCPCINPDYPPDIGLAYLSSYLGRDGHKVSIIDANAEMFAAGDGAYKEKWVNKDTEYEELARIGEEICLASMSSLVQQIISKRPDIVGFSIWSSNYRASLAVAAALKRKKPGVVIVFGGHECRPMFRGDAFAINANVDVVVHGEGELPLSTIARAVKNKMPFAGCPGTIMKEGESNIVITGAQRVMDLDEAPVPDYRKFNRALYSNKKIFILSSRGCVNSCVFCDVPGTIHYRWRSAKSIFKEMKLQLRRHRRVKVFEFAVAAINTNMSELDRLCDLLIRSKIGVKWRGNAFISPALTDAFIEKMSLAGCDALTLGIESGSQTILNRMGKRYTPEDCSRILKSCKKYKIGVVANFIIGFPGETDGDFEKTCEFVRENSVYISSIGSRSLCFVTPYTKLFNEPQKYGINAGLCRQFYNGTGDYNGAVEDYMEKAQCVRDWGDNEAPDNTRQRRKEKERIFMEVTKAAGLDNVYRNITD